MKLKVSKATIVILAIAVLGFGAFFLFVTTTVPGEYEMLADIATLEKQPLPSACPRPSERESLLFEVTKMAHVYKTHQRYEKAAQYFLRVIEIQKQLCGADYPGQLVPMNLLAESYELAGVPEKAALVRQEIRVREEQLKLRHPEWKEP